ncbi:MAG TPA: tetratricopeptide repeat protein [Candidatus Latescibacteria bacterium]|nr:tetratricopeptide repeat protein [Candidatus Latescibacterota bacterium]
MSDQKGIGSDKAFIKRGWRFVPFLFSCLFLLFVPQLQLEAGARGIKELDQMGDRLLETDRYEEAISVWQGALESDPNHVDTLLRIGIAFSLLGRYHQAHATLNRALEIEPENPKVLYNLALVFLRQDRDQKALEYLKRVLEMVAWYPEANYHMGLIYERRGLKERALNYYIRELNYNAASAKTWQRFFRLKDELDQDLPIRSGENVFSTEMMIFISGLILATAGVLFLRRRGKLNA